MLSEKTKAMIETSGAATAIYIIVTMIIVFLIWMAGKAFADSVSEHEVIAPYPGVKCVVVSRMFNTSVDCWKEKS